MARQKNGTPTLGFEAELWATADALRNNMDAAEYEHAVRYLAPAGMAGFVLAYGSMSSNLWGEGETNARHTARIGRLAHA